MLVLARRISQQNAILPCQTTRPLFDIEADKA